MPGSAYEYAERWKQGTLGGATINNWPADSKAFLPYLRAASDGDEDGALDALRQVLIFRPERLWHPYVQSQFGHLIHHGSHPDLPREFRDRANAALVDLVRAWGVGLGYWITIERSPARRGQTPSLFPLIDEQEGMGSTPEADRQFLAANDFGRLWDDLMHRLEVIHWREFRNDYRADSDDSREHTLTAVVWDLKPVLQQFRADYDGPGKHFLAYCGLAGAFPPDQALRQMVRTGLEDKTGHPRETFGHHFLGHFQLVIGGWELMESTEPRTMLPSLIKSTLRTLENRAKKLEELDTGGSTRARGKTTRPRRKR